MNADDDIELLPLAKSERIRDREKFLRMGSELSNPIFSLMFNPELGSETYNKLLLNHDGTCDETTCPVGLLLGVPNWRLWQLTSSDENHVYIAYNYLAKRKNKWYANTITKLPYQTRVPSMKGDLVVFKKNDAIVWNELEWRRELLNYLVCHYTHQSNYKFCEL